MKKGKSAPSEQFSSDTSGDPRDLAQETETLAVPQAGGEVVNIEITETPQPAPVVPESPEPAPGAVSSPPLEEQGKREDKVSQKFTTPAPKTNPGSRPQANGDAASGAAHVAWVQADISYKESQPQIVSDGGKGVSN